MFLKNIFNDLAFVSFFKLKSSSGGLFWCFSVSVFFCQCQLFALRGICTYYFKCVKHTEEKYSLCYNAEAELV